MESQVHFLFGLLSNICCWQEVILPAAMLFSFVSKSSDIPVGAMQGRCLSVSHLQGESARILVGHNISLRNRYKPEGMSHLSPYKHKDVISTLDGTIVLDPTIKPYVQRKNIVLAKYPSFAVHSSTLCTSCQHNKARQNSSSCAPPKNLVHDARPVRRISLTRSIQSQKM